MSKPSLDIEISFLGTGTSTGVPVVGCDCRVCQSADLRDKRLRTSLLLKVNGRTWVIDCGPDFRYQMIRANAENLDALLFTHEHRDHIGGLDDIRGYNYVFNKSIDAYAADSVIQAIHGSFPYIQSSSRFFGSPQVNFHLIDNHVFTIDGIEVIPIRVMHDTLEILGFRIGDLSYVTDASFIAPEEQAKLLNSKVLVINALRNSPHVSHYCLGQALALIEAVRPERAFLTHMSHFIGLHEELEKRLPPGVKPAFDTLCIKVS